MKLSIRKSLRRLITDIALGKVEPGDYVENNCLRGSQKYWLEKSTKPEYKWLANRLKNKTVNKYYEIY